jgi:maltooligosyltrehalose synthase
MASELNVLAHALKRDAGDDDARHEARRGRTRAITVLSEVPDEWRRNVSDWMRINSRHRLRIHGGWAPDRNDEYRFYQALVGTWPAEPIDMPVPERASDELIERMSQYIAKAVREAKVHTSRIHENAEYGHGVEQFVRRTLSSATAKTSSWISEMDAHSLLRSFEPVRWHSCGQAHPEEPSTVSRHVEASCGPKITISIGPGIPGRPDGVRRGEFANCSAQEGADGPFEG